MTSAVRLLCVVAAAYALAGCGTQGGTQGDARVDAESEAAASATPSAEPVATVAGCPATSRPVRDALDRSRLRTDLDGDGTPDPVGVVDGPGRPCDGAVVARIDDVVSGSLGTGDLAVLEVRAVRLTGAGSGLLTRAGHPRRGEQADLLVPLDGVLTPVRVGGEPLLPFVAADTGTGHVAARCAGGGLVVRVAVPHAPPGVVFAYDVVDRRYRLDGAEATLVTEREIADNVLPGQVRRRFPDLAAGRLLEDC